MRLGLISDTHILDVALELPRQIEAAFRGVDLILHAGDVYSPAVLDDLGRIAPVLAAMGDDDPYAIRKDKRVKNKHVLEIENHTIWLIHERPYINVVTSRHKGHEAPDIVVYGHEHDTFVQNCGGVLCVNPGSPTFLNYRLGLGTVGILTIESDKAQAFIIEL